MPARTVTPLGAPIWIDLSTSDIDRAVDFYTGLFGWTAERGGEDTGGYVNFFLFGRSVAGAMASDGQSGQPDAWSTYLHTPDAAATAAAAVAAGGQVLMDAMDVMDFGRMAVLADPSGGAICAWQPGSIQGFDVVSEHGAPNWHELHTRDYAKAVDFYTSVFGWETEVVGDSDEFRYTQQVQNGAPFAGIMDASAFLPAGAPAQWHVYFGSSDVDASIALVESLGGSVLEPAEDTPYGRLATVADPTGASFKLGSLQA
ncbi:VOC family protein [Planctomonas psychrotolerans]|uniref:VOC family protein n=1 Tax=Planctomonas psychrotolerans TaxID=2528712 RepID=UPI001239DE18|nr:VOC family protein [Planctomonas psychrotolerans]